MIFAKLFLISLALLIVSLLATAFIKKTERITGSLVLLFGASSFFLMCAMLAERFFGNRFAFLQPAWLILLLIPVVIAIARIYWPERFMPALSYPLTGQLAPSFSLTALLARWANLLCALFALSAFIIALARPVAVSHAKLPPTQGIDIMMILDASASMNKNDFFPNRFVAAQKRIVPATARTQKIFQLGTWCACCGYGIPSAHRLLWLERRLRHPFLGGPGKSDCGHLHAGQPLVRQPRRRQHRPPL